MKHDVGGITPAGRWDWSEQGVKSALVNADEGWMNSAVYQDEEIYRREIEQIFNKTWQFVGHESQIPKPGDFVATRIGEDPLLLTRHRDGSIHLMLNQCRHRGVRLCKGDYGNVRSFVCSYHAWTFGTDGELLTEAQGEQYENCLDKDDFGLIKVPNVAVYKGLIFGNWDPDCEPLEDYLGDAKWYIDSVVDRTPGGTEMIGLQKWRVRGNWKMGCEQHVSDFYHAHVSHVSYRAAFFESAAFRGLVPEGSGVEKEKGYTYSSDGKGHGGGWLYFPKEKQMMELIEANTQPAIDWFTKDAVETTTERLGRTRAENMVIHFMNIFPNLSFNRVQAYVRLWLPLGPHATEVWNFVIADKDMPQEVKDGLLTGMANVFAAAGCLEQDDTENQAANHLGTKSPHAANTRLNMQMGMGKTITDAKEREGDAYFEGPGIISDVYSEEALRGFYRRYAELMQD